LFLEKQEALWIRDYESTNGTFVNRTRISGEEPLRPGDIIHFSSLEFRLVTGNRTGDQLSASADIDGTLYTNRSELSHEFWGQEDDFLAMLRQGKVSVHFQPVFRLADKRLIAYEALGRGNSPTLPELPGLLFAVARSLGKEVELSELFRTEAIRRAANQGTRTIYFNTLPAEMNLEHLGPSLLRLRQLGPDLRLAMEVHEAAVTDPVKMAELRGVLNDLEIGLLYDDFGAGQARLLEIIKVPPDIVKFDISLITGIHHLPRRELQAIQTLIRMAQDLGIQVLAEGIEVLEEMQTCMELGFDLGQGNYLGKPAPEFAAG
jgi:EAL domain-containing protein (putative c-di-GMP-specific phosphodiesterase class I)